jgi:hypothetical protein
MALAETQATTARRLTCARCGAAFDCDPGGDCWCFAEELRLPLPAEASAAQCLCPACLRTAAVPP